MIHWTYAATSAVIIASILRQASSAGDVVKKVLSIVFLGALLTVSSAVMAARSDADPIIGTWKLNLPRSTFAGVSAYKSQIRTYSRAGKAITLNMTTIAEDGQEIKTHATYSLSGKDYPSMGNPDFDSLSGVRIDANTAEFSLKRAGKEVGKIRREVSKDGRTLTINFVISNADGIQTAALTVFDKQ